MTSRNAAGTVATVLASLCLATVNSLFAQDAGDRVRVTIGGDILTGDVLETSDASFLWWEDDSCEIHGNGIEWGVLGGGVVGFVVGKTALKDKWEIIPPGRRDPTLGPLVDIGSRPNGNPAMILGARIRF